MSFLLFYLYANLYILFFWILYRVVLQNVKDFQANRLYILYSLVSATILPFVQKGLSGLFQTSTEIKGTVLYNFIYSFNSPEKSPALFIKQSIPDAEQVLSLIILAGAMVTVAIFLLNHFKLIGIQRNSRLIRSDFPKVFISNRPIMPFIYNQSIIIPNSVPGPDLEIIIRHESFHHKMAHHLDLILVQVFQSIFWLNPFIYLLKRELFQLHEYQVDQLVVSSGIDSLYYKHILIRSSAGNQKFLVANGLKNNNLKKRILMMNTKISKTGSWKYLLLLPAVSVILLSLSFTSIDPTATSALLPSNGQEVVVPDSLKINIIDLPENFKVNDRNEVLMVLINKVSKILLEGKLVSGSKFEDIFVEEFKSKLERKFGDLKSSMISKEMKAIKIIVQKDRNTYEGNYKELLNKIGTAIFSLQDFYSQKLFSRLFKSLTSDEQQNIQILIPPVIYVDEPMMVRK